MSFFSIIIPTYNSGITLKAGIDTILDQSFKDFEILIMDGSSTDNTLEIARKFNDNRIKIFSEKDSGVYDAMNKGIKNALGEWLLFLGSDDVLFDHSVLQDCFSFQKEKLNLDLFYGDVLSKGKNSRYYGATNLYRLTNEGNLCHQSIFYKKTLFNKLGAYNLNYKVFADWDLNIRCFQHPELQISYFERIIAIYNDLSGLSFGSQLHDIDFLKTIPKYYTVLNAKREIPKIILNKFRNWRPF